MDSSDADALVAETEAALRFLGDRREQFLNVASPEDELWPEAVALARDCLERGGGSEWEMGVTRRVLARGVGSGWITADELERWTERQRLREAGVDPDE